MPPRDAKSLNGRSAPPSVAEHDEHPNDNPITMFAAITTYFGYAILTIFGHVRDLVRDASAAPPRPWSVLWLLSRNETVL